LSIQPQHEITISRAITDSDYRDPASNWHYTIPAISLAVSTSAALAGIIYGFMKLHDYNSSDPYNPKLYEAAISALKVFGFTGIGTVSASVATTLMRAAYQGCSPIPEFAGHA